MTYLQLQQSERHPAYGPIIEDVKDLNIPTCDDILDLDELSQDNSIFQNALVPLIKRIKGWNDITEGSQLIVTRVSGALTNCVFFVEKRRVVSNGSPLKVVLRIYGKGVDQLCSRDDELKWLKFLSPYGIGPELLLIFGNGRFEKFLESITLTSKEIRCPNTYIHVAKRIAALHNMAHIYPPEQGTDPLVWTNIAKWYTIVSNNIQNFTEKQRVILQKFNLSSLKDEIRLLKKKLLLIDSPIILAHNDLQPGNILRLTDGSDELVAVDFEYAGYNYRGFDLSNFFCEFMFDFHDPKPHVLHKDRYPKEADKLKFLESYLSDDSISTISDDVLQKLVIECDAFALTSHVMWGLWGLIQCLQSNINFDYFEYAMQRLRMFRALKNKIYKKIDKSFS
ncbi:1970_t:CDS:2 [Dentiscutata heterogama]|uniref:1970_t:CDS:1 n=1 Tax=Dentiscutata heterogama TaxID=1316150 RepID=A0ACA9MEW4_9GLOM|nr:1970_t:CDS:2 [Dentiscutata heterogama]